MNEVFHDDRSLVPHETNPVVPDESGDVGAVNPDDHAWDHEGRPHGDQVPATAGMPAPVSDEMVERVLAVGEAYEPDEIAALRREWPGPEMNRNLGYVKAFIDTYVPADLQAEIPDSVAMLRLGAHVARQVLSEKPRSRVSKNSGEVGDVDRDALLDQATTYRRLRDAAQARGDRRNVLRYDEKERQVLAQLGNAPVVGQDRRTA